MLVLARVSRAVSIGQQAIAFATVEDIAEAHGQFLADLGSPPTSRRRRPGPPTTPTSAISATRRVGAARPAARDLQAVTRTATEALRHDCPPAWRLNF
jgi:hypothetical protein